jgi:hypothetical protein
MPVMRLLLVFALAGLLACVSDYEPAAGPSAATPATTPAEAAPRTAPAPRDTLDLRRWIEAALALDEIEDYEQRAARARALTDELDAVTGWKEACYPEEAEGNLMLYPLSGGGYVAEVTCFLAAYQANFTVVYVAPERATVLPLPLYDETGAVLDPEATNFGGLLMDDDPTDRRFAIFSKSRGMGDCGSWSLYEVSAGAAARAVEVRMRGCEMELPDELPPPQEWPVVYPR